MGYRYTLLKQDGSETVLQEDGKRMSVKRMYEVLDCTTVELIPRAYYEGKATMFGDEEGRYNKKNKRNPHFKVLQGADFEPAEWDVVGNVIKEVKV